MKIDPITKLPLPAIHGNVKYRFDELTAVGKYFLVEDASKQGSIATSLQNYNKKNKTSIKVSTRKVRGGLIVMRTR